ncbi:MAG: OmpA family protein [bacterium]
MSPPGINSGSTQLRTQDAGTDSPPVTPQASDAGRTDATAADASAPAPASSASAPAPASSAPAPAQSSNAPAPAATVSTRGRIDIELDGFAGSARLGGPDGSLFTPNYSPANEGWNYTRFGIRGGFSYTLWNPIANFRLRAGAHGGYFNLSGDRHSPGRMDGGELGAHLDAGFPIGNIFEPYLRISASVLYATGDTTAGNSFTVGHTQGFGVDLSAMLGANFHLGAFSVMPFFRMGTGTIFNARNDSTIHNANAPWVDIGGGVLASYNIDGSQPSVMGNPNLCDEQTPARVRREITRLQGEVGTLRADEPRLRQEARTSHPELTDAQLDDILGTVPTATRVPDPLPTDCESLVELQNRLEAERDALDRRGGMLAVIPLIHGGAATPEVIHAVTQIRNVQFGTRVPFSSAPVSASDRIVRGMNPDLVVIENVEQRTQAAIAAAPGGRVPADTLRGLFEGIFLNTYRPGGVRANPSMEGLNEVAEGLRGLPDRYRYIIVGSTDSRGADDYNMRLSDRRARATAAYLRASSGLSAEHFISMGLGETELTFHYDQLAGQHSEAAHVVTRQEQRELSALGITGQALRELVLIRQGMNRGVQVIIYDPQNPTPLARRLMDAYNAAHPAPGGQAPTPQVQAVQP